MWAAMIDLLPYCVMYILTWMHVKRTRKRGRTCTRTVNKGLNKSLSGNHRPVAVTTGGQQRWGCWRAGIRQVRVSRMLFYEQKFYTKSRGRIFSRCSVTHLLFMKSRGIYETEICGLTYFWVILLYCKKKRIKLKEKKRLESGQGTDVMVSHF